MKRRALSTWLLAAACGLTAGAVRAVWDLGALMALLAANPPGRATFVEKKYFAMLEAPVTSSGELLFTPPGRLERRTVLPRAETLLLDGNTLTITRGNRQMVLQLQEQPAVVALTESVRATLAGDRPALERHYQVALEGSAARWALTLVPREPRTRALVLEIRIEGERGEVRTVETFQADKDRSVLAIRRVAAP